MQLYTAEDDRKFIISNHIYPGAKIEDTSEDLLFQTNNTALVKILQRYNGKILLEVSGHDHISDLRYHLGSLMPTSSSESTQYQGSLEANNDIQLMFHNLLIAPGATAASFQNPGYATFTIDESDPA